MRNGPQTRHHHHHHHHHQHHHHIKYTSFESIYARTLLKIKIIINGFGFATSHQYISKKSPQHTHTYTLSTQHNHKTLYIIVIVSQAKFVGPSIKRKLPKNTHTRQLCSFAMYEFIEREHMALLYRRQQQNLCS